MREGGGAREREGGGVVEWESERRGKWETSKGKRGREGYGERRRGVEKERGIWGEREGEEEEGCKRDREGGGSGHPLGDHAHQATR